MMRTQLPATTALVLCLAIASPVLGLAPSATPSAAAMTERVSVATDGRQARGGIGFAVAVSDDGRYVAFDSDADDLVAGDTNGFPDIFVRDRLEATTERVNLSARGEQANGRSQDVAISADGRFVAFVSLATDLSRRDTNSWGDLYVHDRELGTTDLVSVPLSGQTDGDSSWPAISADGRFVAFVSGATRLVADDTNQRYDVFVRDRTRRTIERVSVGGAGEADMDSFDPAISADGRFVAFQSLAANLTPCGANGTDDLFVYDRLLGTTECVSEGADGTPANDHSGEAAISADGRVVAFASSATNLVPDDTNERRDVFVRDRERGTTTRVSVGFEGQAVGDSFAPAISSDGRFVAFYSNAANLVPDDTNESGDMFVHDRELGTIERVSVGGAGQADRASWDGDISLDGRFVAFSSDAANLVPDDTNEGTDVFVRGPLR